MNPKTTNVQRKCQGSLQLFSPPFLMTSTTEQMRPNGRGAEFKEKLRQSTIKWSTISWNIFSGHHP